MKKNLFYVMITIVSMLLVSTSCGKSGKDLDYKKACEEKDFVRAYEIVDQLRQELSDAQIDYNRTSERVKSKGLFGEGPGGYALEEHGKTEAKYEVAQRNYAEAERYVILQEAIYVLESQGAGGLVRVVGIAKEHNAESWLYSELLDVAKKIGDTDLAEKIQNIIGSEEENGTGMWDSYSGRDMESMMKEAEKEYEKAMKEFDEVSKAVR